MPANILVIDDGKLDCDSISHVVIQMGHDLESAYTLKKGEGQGWRRKF